MTRFLMLCVACFLVPMWPRALAGGMTSSGGELITTETNPWFIDGVAVRYCIDQGEDFSVDMFSARTVIREALEEWSRTIDRLAPKATPLDLVFGDGRRQKNINLSFREVSCAHEPRLRFYLGTSTPAIDDALTHMATHTVGLALREQYDEDTGSVRRGSIWLVPDRGARAYQGPQGRRDFWRHRPTFRNVVLHELGHVFGFPHDDGGSVMATALPARVVEENPDQIFSPVTLLLDQWMREGFAKTACGPLTSSRTAAEMFFQLTGTPERACISAANHGQSPLALRLFARRELLLEIPIEFSSGVGEGGLYHRGMAVRGHYKFLHAWPQTPFRHHDFLQMTTGLRIEGVMNLQQGRAPVQIERGATMLEISQPWKSIIITTWGGVDASRLRLSFKHMAEQ